MQKIIFLFLLFFVAKATAQVDSVEVDSAFVQELDSYSVTMPFSKAYLNNLPIISKNIIPQTDGNIKSYFFLFLLNLIAIAVFLFTISRTKLKKLIATFFSLNMLIQYAKVETKRDNSYLWAYFVLFLMFLATIIYVLSLNFNLNFDVFKITMFVLIFLLSDFLTGFFTAYILKLEELKEMIHFNNFSFIVIIVPFLIISVLILLFLSIQNTFIISLVVFIVLILSYLWKELRNLLILKANRINIFSFYFFLYLCTFKILPLAIFFKITFSEILRIYK